MRWQHQWWSVLVAAVLGGLVGMTAVVAAGGQVLAILGAGHPRPHPPAFTGRVARGRLGWAAVSLCLHRPDQLLESEHGQAPLHRPTGWRYGSTQGPENCACLPG